MCYNTRGRTSCSSCQLEHLGSFKLFPCSSNGIPPRHQSLLFIQEFLLRPGSQPRRIIWSHVPLADPLFSAQSPVLSLASKRNYNNFCFFYLKIHLLKYATHSHACVCLCVSLSFSLSLLASPIPLLLLCLPRYSQHPHSFSPTPPSLSSLSFLLFKVWLVSKNVTGVWLTSTQIICLGVWTLVPEVSMHFSFNFFLVPGNLRV